MPHTHDVTLSGDRVRKAYVAWDQDEPDREWAALQHLALHAPGLAPEPIERTAQDGRPVVVMSRMPGEPLTGEVSGPVLDALLTALRRLFAVPVPTDLPMRANAPATLRRTTASWFAGSHDLTLCVDPELVAGAVEQAITWLAAPRRHDAIVDPVVALGDGNLDNVMWDGRTCRLIDWEEFGASDLTYEVADLVEHASSRLEQRLDVDGLLAALALTRTQRTRLVEHRRILACFWLAMLLPGNAGFRRNPSGSVEDQARHVLALLV
jgi:aminoglycoside phosphotransferase